MKIFKPFLFIFSLIFIGVFSACDKVEEPYTEIKPAGGDTTKRMVIIEDYTGHKCVNCPGAALIAHSLEEIYEGQVMVMAIHATFFASPDQTGQFTANYTTEAGNTWSNHYGIESAPYGLINRRFFTGDHTYINPKYWGNAVEKFVELPKLAMMSICNTYNQSSRILNTKIDTKFLEQIPGTINLTVCILQDSIISPQKNNDPLVGPVPVIENYVYMGMLRGTISSIWGDMLSSSTGKDAIVSKMYSYHLNEAWVAEHCTVIAFISDAATNEILHAVKKPLIQRN